MKLAKQTLQNESGFTLIEIISVLILLGILSAVAVPKYIDLQTQAQQKAVDAAVAEGVAQVNQYAAKSILTTGTVPADLAALKTAGICDASATDCTYTEGDFVITFTDGAAGSGIVNVSAAGKGDPIPTSITASKPVTLPKS